MKIDLFGDVVCGGGRMEKNEVDVLCFAGCGLFRGEWTVAEEK